MRVALTEQEAGHFSALLAQEGLADALALRDVEVFDEVPLYSRTDQLSFLSGLTKAQANRRLVVAAALHLAAVEEALGHRPEGVLRLVSVTGWLDQDPSQPANYAGETALLTPRFWLANLSSPQLGQFTIRRPWSSASAFVRDTLGDDPRFSVSEGPPDRFGAPVPERVYVAVTDSPTAAELTARVESCSISPIQRRPRSGSGVGGDDNPQWRLYDWPQAVAVGRTFREVS